jgi:hypothetical protein
VLTADVAAAIFTTTTAPPTAPPTTSTTTLPTTTTTTSAPAIATDDLVVVRPNGRVIIAVLANDTGSLDLQTLEITSTPASGSVVLVGQSGKLRYTAGGAFSGDDAFEYSICTTDGACDTATVELHEG